MLKPEVPSMDKSIEEKWLMRWESEKLFHSDPDPSREKKLVTFPFPYMNGPLHIGHGFTATRVDVYARFKRMQGYNVLFPWAWHWTGQPIVAAAERLSKGDAAMLREFIEIDKIPKNEISKFYDPKYMAQYYTDSGRVALRRLGLSIDWRREFHTTDLEPHFNRFVLWQYNKLRDMGYVTRGTHPVVWCPKDQSPTGDHDRVEGEGVTWEEFTLVFFPITSGDFKGDILPAATFRPETIFGVTNLWLNPDGDYVEISVDGKDSWVVSGRAANKLKDQNHEIEIKKQFKGSALINAFVSNPVSASHNPIPVFPASFVDVNNGTGVVYSVPAHAPMDYIALVDLRHDTATQKKYSLDAELVSSIQPIDLITIPGMGKYPAVEIVEKMGITNQLDKRVDEATNEIYKKEFHQGVLKENATGYAGKRVSEVKQLIVEQLKNNGVSGSMYDLPERVVCRCLTECTVKVLQDQWFLKYSDPKWKKTAHDCVDNAQIYPESARQWFHDVIDWMKDWPCARRVGLGTPLPWAPGWIVETLSDSTIYMGFYTIRARLIQLGIKAESLTDAFFDYVFLGNGNPAEIEKVTQIGAQDIQGMRDEFLYWYPVNLRNSAKELIPNHLTFFIFQHVAFFPRELWPTGISSNGMMMVEGVKMSKSKGNVITLTGALDSYGADALRAALISGAEGMDDLDWREKNVIDIRNKLDALSSFLSSLMASVDPKDSTKGVPELWLENQVQKHISEATDDLESMKTKSAFQEVFFSLWSDIRYYLMRTGSRPEWLLKYIAETMISLLSPFLPYTCEELSSQLSFGHGFASTRLFPNLEDQRVHKDAEISELAINRLVEDTQKIVKLLPEQPKVLHVYVAPEWETKMMVMAIEARAEKEKMADTLQKFFKSFPNVPKKDAANCLPRVSSMINELGDDFTRNFLRNYDKVDEMSSYEGAIDYLKRILNIDVIVHSANDRNPYDPKSKSRYALPFKPALYLE